MGVKIEDDERELFSTWTELDGDLEGCDEHIAQTVLASRLMFARGDRSRTDYWKVPEDIDVIADIPYVDDGLRAHKLDVYLPHDVVVRGGKTAPVYIDIHGGGFMYGHKELNRNFNTHLAQQGFVVFSVNYRVMPEGDFLDQLADVEAAFAWIRNHIGDYPVDPLSIFLTGDSAGGTLALYATAVERSQEMADALGLNRSGLNIKGSALISGLFDLKPYLDAVDGVGDIDESSPTGSMKVIAPVFFKTLKERGAQWADLDYMAAHVDLPPLFLNTSNDDFLQGDAMRLGAALCDAGRDFELHDRHTCKGQTLGHVYPVCMSWLEESQETLRQIRDFSYNLL
ncbi:alpha/beta hydrolase [Bifidobacterium sp. ESL0682]|uniref:alpha/beta hydrolase n=1 Tax=Bifidobacterium sp. ESL0682 TaxID=2983212 RepID=UPI0023F98211|nr:alpha/beta hydrolase [Bifidobacterium sp. ESL0682]WEV42762.1 alpha/beta hydrolase [Bifidobacterium sp. ESL0682]